jgi:hypothetical protein
LTEGTENNDNTPQKDERGRSYANWVYWSLAGLIFYILSPGPIIYILVKLEVSPDNSIVSKIFAILYYPLYPLADNVSFYEAYIEFWLRLAGA